MDGREAAESAGNPRITLVAREKKCTSHRADGRAILSRNRAYFTTGLEILISPRDDRARLSNTGRRLADKPHAINEICSCFPCNYGFINPVLRNSVASFSEQFSRCRVYSSGNTPSRSFLNWIYGWIYVRFESSEGFIRSSSLEPAGNHDEGSVPPRFKIDTYVILVTTHLGVGLVCSSIACTKS